MPKRYSIVQARQQLAKVVRDAKRGAPVELTRRGELVAVVLSPEAFRRLSQEPVNFGAFVTSWRREYAVESLALCPEELFGEVRTKESGRDVSF